MTPRQSGTGVAGTLRVTMSSTFGRMYISPLLPELLALHPAVRLSVGLDDQKVDLVSAGLDLWHVSDDLRSGRLRQVLPGYGLADTGIHAVMPQRRLVPPRVRAFVDFLAVKFGGTPPWEREA